MRLGAAYRLRARGREPTGRGRVVHGASGHRWSTHGRGRRPDAGHRRRRRPRRRAQPASSSPGLITFDTKLDLQFDPGGFLARSLSLWNGDSAVGGLQNQASGYLFPMGPAFLLGHALGVPMWVWERLWSAA